MRYTDDQVREMVQGSTEDKVNLAKQGYCLPTLLHDTDKHVRVAVAKKRYGLDTLVWDDAWEVRYEVAKFGYGFEILMNDGDDMVKRLVYNIMNSKRYVLATNFGTYYGELVLHVMTHRYLIISGCFATHSLEEWSLKCEEQLDYERAIKYTHMIQDILKEEL